jgi:AcrR family transcriptional regulator
VVVATRTAWLDEGLQALATSGILGLRISQLSLALQVTKGSFYHHFVDLADYRRALLAHFEERWTTRYIDANARLSALAPVDHLLSLGDAVLEDEETYRGIEVQIRCWATQDDDAHDTLARVDERRVAYLNKLTRGIVDDPERAADLASTIYYLLIGSEHAIPGGSPAQLRRLWEQALDAASRVDP